MLALLHATLAAAAATPSPNGTGANATHVLSRIPLKQLQLLVPEGEVSGQVRIMTTLRCTCPCLCADYLLQAAVTAVFSRAVIALGSNFGPETPGGAVRGVAPLLWSCNGGGGRGAGAAPVPGRTYWVTTSIVRFDPSSGWGNDLKCTVGANPALRSFDGARLAAPPAHKVRMGVVVVVVGVVVVLVLVLVVVVLVVVLVVVVVLVLVLTLYASLRQGLQHATAARGGAAAGQLRRSNQGEFT